MPVNNRIADPCVRMSALGAAPLARPSTGMSLASAASEDDGFVSAVSADDSGADESDAEVLGRRPGKAFLTQHGQPSPRVAKKASSVASSTGGLARPKKSTKRGQA